MNKNKGFVLTELVLVILVIGICASTALYFATSATTDAQNVTGKYIAATISTASNHNFLSKKVGGASRSVSNCTDLASLFKTPDIPNPCTSSEIAACKNNYCFYYEYMYGTRSNCSGSPWPNLYAAKSNNPMCMYDYSSCYKRGSYYYRDYPVKLCSTCVATPGKSTLPSSYSIDSGSLSPGVWGTCTLRYTPRNLTYTFPAVGA